MNVTENNEVKLLGFRINNTAAVILFFLSLTTIIRTNPILTSEVDNLLYLFRTYSISFLFETFLESLIRLLISVIVLIIVMNVSLYILIACAIKQRVFRKNEDKRVRWLFFRLTDTSLLVLCILSLTSLIIVLHDVIGIIDLLIWYLEDFTRFIDEITNLTKQLIVPIFLILIYTYTLIVCIRNRKKIADRSEVKEYAGISQKRVKYKCPHCEQADKFGVSKCPVCGTKLR